MDNINNITRIDFPKSYETASACGFTQWDQGQKLEISGLDISNEIVEVHFSLDEYNGKAKRRLGTVVDGVIHVDIPVFVLEGPEYCGGETYNAYAWIYVSDDESAETKRKIELEIVARSKPEDYVTPEELSFLQQLEAYIGRKVDKSGHAPNMYLGTDENGNVVTRESSGGVTDEQVKSAVEEYLEENPISVTEKDPTVPDWAKQPKKPSYTATEVGALSDETKVPTKTSELENDSGFITKEHVENYSVVLSHDGNGNATIKGLVVLLDGNEVTY